MYCCLPEEKLAWKFNLVATRVVGLVVCYGMPSHRYCLISLPKQDYCLEEGFFLCQPQAMYVIYVLQKLLFAKYAESWEVTESFQFMISLKTDWDEVLSFLLNLVKKKLAIFPCNNVLFSELLEDLLCFVTFLSHQYCLLHFLRSSYLACCCFWQFHNPMSLKKHYQKYYMPSILI